MLLDYDPFQKFHRINFNQNHLVRLAQYMNRETAFKVAAVELKT